MACVAEDITTANIIAPLYIGMPMVQTYQHHPNIIVPVEICTQAGIHPQERVPTYGQNMGSKKIINIGLRVRKLLKLQKFIFTILHLLLDVIVVTIHVSLKQD